MSTQLQAPTPPRQHRSLPGRSRPVGNRKVVAQRLVGGAVVLWGLLALIGLLVTRVVTSGRGQSWDGGVDVWVAARRTGFWNTVTMFGSGLANTSTAIAVTAVAVVLLRWRLGRWYESWIVVAAIAGELLVFLAVTATVHRPRPPVTRLDVAPPTSSFPSGHTAAAIALYGCLAVLLMWVYGRRPATRVAAVVLFCIPVVVGLSRLYRGMHYPSDILVGALGGGLWLLLVITTLLPHRGSVEPTQEQ
jgi:membrane-associated phospholipid phosphatase